MRKFFMTAASAMVVLSAAAADSQAPVTNPPGEPSFYAYSCQYFFNTGAGINFYSGSNMAMEVIWDGNDVYMSDPVYGHLTRSYIKGTFEPEENRVYFEFPQLVEDGADGKYYASFLKAQNTLGSDGRYKLTYVVPEDDNSIFFSVGADGSLFTPSANAEGEYPSFLIGIINEEGVWDGNGTSNYKLTAKDYKVTQLPAGKEPERWILEYDNEGSLADVLIDGQDVYFGNFCPYTRYYMHGKMREEDGRKVVSFAGSQFLGTYSPFFYFMTSIECTKVSDGDDWYYSFPTAEEIGDDEDIPWDETIDFVYDAEKRELSLLNPGRALLFNPGLDVFYPFMTMYNPQLRAVPENPVYDKPRTPLLVMAQQYDIESGDVGLMVIDLPQLDVNGNLLDLDKTWFEVYFDDELKEFGAPEYPYVDEPMTQIPYKYSDSNFWDIYTSGSLDHYVYYFSPINKAAVRMITEDPTGVRHYSDFAYWPSKTPSGVDKIDASADSPVEYFDMTGRRVTPAPGQMVIRRSAEGAAKVIF